MVFPLKAGYLLLFQVAASIVFGIFACWFQLRAQASQSGRICTLQESGSPVRRPFLKPVGVLLLAGFALVRLLAYFGYVAYCPDFPHVRWNVNSICASQLLLLPLQVGYWALVSCPLGATAAAILVPVSPVTVCRQSPFPFGL